jgi:hypothetical protein
VEYSDPEIAVYKDPLQFAYSDGLSVEDALLTVVHTIHSHLDDQNTYVRALFIDFSSAFNTISPLVLVKKLVQLNISPLLVLWIGSFLTNRQQQVRFGSAMSTKITTNTGAPQGCVLSPLLFTAYTSDCRSTSDCVRIIKYADDTVLLGLLRWKSSEVEYRECISDFVSWCDSHHLILNAKKTKELVFNYSRNVTNEKVTIKEEEIEIVESYKYLGSFIDDKLKWTQNTENLTRKASKRLYFLRKLKKCGVDNSILSMFYESVISSVISFCLVAWYGCISNEMSQQLERIWKTAKRIIKCDSLKTMDVLYKQKVMCIVPRILSNPSHPLRPEFHILKSGHRLRVCKTRTSRFKNTFVPLSIISINSLQIDSRRELIDLLSSQEHHDIVTS